MFLSCPLSHLSIPLISHFVKMSPRASMASKGHSPFCAASLNEVTRLHQHNGAIQFAQSPHFILVTTNKTKGKTIRVDGGPPALTRLSEGAVSTDDEQDRQLSKEVNDSNCFQDCKSTPVPLLTPPKSPLLCVNGHAIMLLTM